MDSGGMIVPVSGPRAGGAVSAIIDMIVVIIPGGG
jgi:hypothetical protein